MKIRIKEGVDFEELRKFGFKPGKEWADAGERCLQGEGYEYKDDWWHKFLMDYEDASKIAYIDDEFDIPCVEIAVRTGQRDIYVDIGTYHICGSDLDIVIETIMDLTQAGLLEKQ